MREDLTTIISTLIKGVSTGDAYTEDVCNGLEIIKKNWPNLSDIEKEEINVLIKSLKTIEEGQEIKRFF